MKDKKKLMIVAILAVVVLGVGAFQFMGGSGNTPPASSDKKKPAQATDAPATDAPKNPGVAQPLAERDPFAVPKSAEPTPTAPPPTTPQPNNVPHGHMVRNTEHVPPVEIDGQLPSAVPGAGPAGPTGPIGPGGNQAIVKAEPEFSYKVVGVMVGSKPCAVFADSQGNQRLVPLGGSIDSNTKVVGIEKGKVTVRSGSKTLHFDMGGNPSGK